MEREASAVLLVRGEGPDLEIYLVERAKELRFFGGYLAVPGGVRGPEDGDDADALHRCAVRELFEETGVLLLPAGDASDADRRRAREALLEDDHGPWQALVDATVRLETLRDVCRIRTPPFAPVRYDTVFALARLPDGQQPEIWPGELTSGAFWRPTDALTAWRRGEILIVPPVIILLELLVDRGLDAFAAAAYETAEGYRRGDLHRVRFSPGVIMASLETPTLPPATTTNCLIVGERSLYVIDPASPHEGEQERLFALLEELQSEGRTLEAILATHHHPDHIGAVAAVSERFDLPVYGHQLTLSRLPDGPRLGEPLADGDRIPLGEAPDGSDGWYLEAIFTPGHDRGHLCFHESRYHALIAGDMLSTVSTIVIDPPEGHMRTYLDSLERLRGREITTLYPAHGPAFRDGPALVRRYLAHREKRQAKVSTALAAGLTTIEDMLPVVYDDTDERMYPWAARSLLAGLQMLEEQGTAREHDGAWRPA